MKSTNIRSLVYTALFAALFILFSMQQMKLNFTQIPITLQTLAVILAGLFLRPRDAFASIFVVIILCAMGLNVFGGKGGISHLLGYTGGFIAAFPICAMLISIGVGKWLNNDKLRANKLLSFLALFLLFEVFGSLLAYVPGVPWMMHVLDFPLSKGLAAGFYPFLPGDAIKSVVAVIIALSLTPQIMKIRSSAKPSN
ncbi:biotin transporter BioY [Paenibacillus sp. J5C_2022]|uniref:biotin transporter BioY n=1 Tax=Paenibacillus sp. J5C2022 TaxID=2977129 RepID=UPI0021CE7291|nr:biotin transporter BioY [Paenibacillus sp. J5C2022]MCU6707186.1 biotin transporter BioY [Paenibacillus sp. J5C2022]